MKQKKRKADLNMKTKWDLSYLYIDDNAWVTEYNSLSEKVKNLELLSSSFLNTTKSFLNYLESKIEIDMLIEKIYCYPKRNLDIDCTLDKYKQMLNDALSLYNQIQVLNNCFEKKIIENDKLVMEYLENKELQHYRRYITLILRRKEHILFKDNYVSSLNKIREDYQKLFIDTVKFDDIVIDGEVKLLNRNTYNDLILSEKQANRKKVYDTYTKAYALVNDELASLYISKLNEDINLSKCEKYDTLLSKRLYELELPDNILDELMNKINDNLFVMHKYNKLKKDILGLKDYHVYDSSVSICDIPKINYPLDKSLEIIKNSLGILGDDYVKIINQMFNDGWVDVYPHDNKRVMSFTCISYSGVPYILVNYNNSINSARTLAHEIGHSIHTLYSKNHNHFEYFEFSLFLTEIVSKVNEILVNEYMLKTCKSKEEKIYILNNVINSLCNSLFNQMMLTEFEHHVIKKINEKEVIDSAYLNNLYITLFKKYNGDSFIYDDNIKYGWCKVPHLIMQDTYYLYQYVIGTAVANNIAYRILNKEDGIIEKYKEFLSFGNRLSIKESLKYLDIDLEKGEYVDDSIKVLNKKIDDIKELF